MFRHTVMFRWEAGVDFDHVERVREALAALPGQIEEIRSYLHGSDVGISDGNWDYAVVADFDNVQDFITYRDHPAHQLVIEELIKGYITDRAAVQYQYGGY